MLSIERLKFKPFSEENILSNGKPNPDAEPSAAKFWYWLFKTCNFALLAFTPNNCANSNWLIHFNI